VPFVLLLIGAVALVAAMRNTQGDLATALETDVPAFGKWGLAIVGVGALGWVEGMRTISRGLVALVLLVLVLVNYKALFAGFQGATTIAQPTTPAPTPAAAYVANPTSPNITQANVSGTGSSAGGNVNAMAGPQVSNPFGAFDPAAYLTAFEQGVGGFGGIA
jgi:hypothetical protein